MYFALSVVSTISGIAAKLTRLRHAVQCARLADFLRNRRSAPVLGRSNVTPSVAEKLPSTSTTNVLATGDGNTLIAGRTSFFVISDFPRLKGRSEGAQELSMNQAAQILRCAYRSVGESSICTSRRMCDCEAGADIYE